MLVVILIIALTTGSGSSNSSSTNPGAAGVSSSTAPATTPSDSYFNALASSNDSADFANIPDNILLGIGEAYCNDLNTGSVQSMVNDGQNVVNEYGSEYGFTNSNMVIVIDQAVDNLCPQYTSALQQYESN